MKIQTNDGRLHLADCAHVYSSPPGKLDVATATEWAQHTDLISVNPGKEQGHGDIIAAYSHAGIYTKADHDGDGLPQDEYAHHWDGSTLRRKQVSGYTPSIFIMQPDSAWRNKHRDDLLALRNRYPWCSWFFKDTARASYDIGGSPVVPGTRTTASREHWQAMLRANFASWDAAVGYTISCINGLAADTVQSFAPSVGMIEAAFRLLDGTLPSEAEWDRLGDLVWQAQAAGWTPWLYAKLRVYRKTDPFTVRARKLTVASAYLWDRGSLLYQLGGREGSDPSWITKEYLDPAYRPGIGTPRTTATNWRDYARPEGGYARVYSAGRVFVNPTTAPIAYRLFDGSVWRVDAQSGLILRRLAHGGWSTVL